MKGLVKIRMWKRTIWYWVTGRADSSCSTSGTRRVNLVTNQVISREWGKDREVFSKWWLQLYQRNPWFSSFLVSNTRRVPLVEQELPALPEHLSFLRFLVGFVLLDLWFYMYVLYIVVCPFVLFLNFTKETLGSVASLLVTTLHQGNPDRNHKPWNIVSSERYILHLQVLLECCYI
jgi:hypothetical protein